jgi:hypothetical protein
MLKGGFSDILGVAVRGDSEARGDQLHLTMHSRSGRGKRTQREPDFRAWLERARHIPRPKSGMTRLVRA